MAALNWEHFFQIYMFALDNKEKKTLKNPKSCSYFSALRAGTLFL